MANNIKLIEAHIQESLKQINVSGDAVLDAWSNFEKKYSNINIVNQSAQKASKNESTREPIGSYKIGRWILFAVAALIFVLVGYFAWPYVLLWTSSKPEQNKDTVLTVTPLPVINTPPTALIKTDTVKKDTLIIVPKVNLQQIGTNQNVVSNANTNTNINKVIPVVKKPQREVKVEETPKTENAEVKKTEGEFDFFDKPANDSLRVN